MFEKEKKIYFQHVDPAGILYFSHVFPFVHQVYEDFIQEKMLLSWEEWFQNPHWIIPLVHVEADYKIPLLGGESYLISLKLSYIGNSSFILDYTFTKNNDIYCIVKTVNVFCNRETNKKIPIPDSIREKFNLFYKSSISI